MKSQFQGVEFLPSALRVTGRPCCGPQQQQQQQRGTRCAWVRSSAPFISILLTHSHPSDHREAPELKHSSRTRPQASSSRNSPCVSCGDLVLSTIKPCPLEIAHKQIPDHVLEPGEIMSTDNPPTRPAVRVARSSPDGRCSSSVVRLRKQDLQNKGQPRYAPPRRDMCQRGSER